MQVQMETITPATAAEYLKANTANRPCSPGRVLDLAGAMKRGEWVKNGDAIRFSEDGVLLDGQGRLKACVSAKTSFETLVVRGLDPESFKTIDLGKKRSGADALALVGEKNTNRLAAALRFVLMYESGGYNNASYTPTQIEECLHRHPGMRFWMQFSQLSRITTRCALVQAIGYIGSITRPQEAQTFMRLLCDGSGLEKGSPVLALRDRLQLDKSANTKLPPGYMAQIVIHAYNAYVKSDKRAILKGNRNSSELPRVAK